MTSIRNKRYKKPHKGVTRKRGTRKRVTRKSAYKGGKVLGIGADGCVFSEASWPCATPLPGYDPSDPTVVSKLVPTEDNEDTVIRLALSIVSPEETKHLIGFIGTCKPATAPYGNVYAKQLKENETEIFDMYDKFKSELRIYDSNGEYIRTTDWSPSEANACIRLVDRQSVSAYPYKYKIYDSTKAIINKKYQSTFHAYMVDRKNGKHPNTSLQKIIKAYIQYIYALETLAIGKNDNRIVNIDLHGSNIFVNEESTGELIIGAADFGRCAIQQGSEYVDRTKYTKYLTDYIREFDVAFGYSIIPFELKLYSFLKYPHKYTRYTIDKTDVKGILNEFARILHRTEHQKFVTPFGLFTEDTIKNILIRYFQPFSKMLVTYEFKDIREEIEFIRICFLNRFNSLGALQTFFRSNFMDDDNGELVKKLADYLLHDIDFMPTNENEILYKFYFDTLLDPHKKVGLEPTPIKYIAILLRGGPHAFSTAMAAALTTLPSKRTVSYVSPPSPVTPVPPVAPPSSPVVAPLNKKTQKQKQKVTKTFIPGAAAAAAVGTPRYVTHGAIKKDPTLLSKLLKGGTRRRRHRS